MTATLLARRGSIDPAVDQRLATLESHAIFVLREVAAECERPALLFSGGKDSVVLAHENFFIRIIVTYRYFLSYCKHQKMMYYRTYLGKSLSF